MIVAAILSGYALLLGAGLPQLAARALSSPRAPRLAIAMWVSACVSVVVSLCWAGVALAQLGPMAELVVAGPAGSANPVLSAFGVAMVWGVLLRIGYVATRQAFATHRFRRQHRAALRLAGRSRPDLGATVVPGEIPAAYCVPGRRAEIVVTTSALRVLGHRGTRAVLAHERAHLAGRHHHLLLPLTVLDAAIPGIPLFRRARNEVATLVEMLADDHAAREHGRLPLAHALAAVAGGAAPASSLGAGGEAVRRVRRLVAPPPALTKPAQAAGALVSAAGIAFPFIVACAQVATVLCLPPAVVALF
ncbi:M56 family metallopeptidase [Amycolatopsis sp. H6(2020)]|nr:M56 family metallopeptidase [Amycolatopsis sp. H6(2020)]